MRDRSSPIEGVRGRRRFLEVACGLAGVVATGGLLGLAGCTRPPDEPAPVRVDLAAIPIGARVVVEWDGKPVEVLRRPGGVQVFSLLCTHMGCRIRWDGNENRYVCPCHEGRYDETGVVVSGPPTEPLRIVPWTRDGSDILLGG